MAGKPYSKEFEYLWRVYPKRWDRTRTKWIKRKKYPAWEKWQLLDEETQHEILTKAQFIRDFEGSHACDLVTWLNQRGWDDIEFNKDYVPVLPEELTKDFGHPDALKTVDPNMARTINIRKLNAG